MLGHRDSTVTEHLLGDSHMSNGSHATAKITGHVTDISAVRGHMDV
jgi:hypothetical protein